MIVNTPLKYIFLYQFWFNEIPPENLERGTLGVLRSIQVSLRRSVIWLES